jgi:hypothetical protein
MINPDTNADKTKFKNRLELKGLFRDGSIPDEKQFEMLIDSMVNRLEDGFSKDTENGMQISPIGTDKRFISFYEGIEKLNPLFFIEKGDDAKPGLNFGSKTKENILFFDQDNGNVGVGKVEPLRTMDVNGFVSADGRVGNNITKDLPDPNPVVQPIKKDNAKPDAKPGDISKQWWVKADGQWHAIATKLDNCQAFEVVARAGKKGKGKFAIMHAIAVSVYGPKGKIRRTNANYGFFWNKIKLRWTGTVHNYNLEIKTSNNYGKDETGRDAYIYYSITRLWDDLQFLPHDELYEPEKKD